MPNLSAERACSEKLGTLIKAFPILGAVIGVVALFYYCDVQLGFISVSTPNKAKTEHGKYSNVSLLSLNVDIDIDFNISERGTSTNTTSTLTLTKHNCSRYSMEKHATFAIVFSALARSMKYTVDSVQKNLLGVLEQHNISYHTYIHSYTLSRPYGNVYRDGLHNYTLDLDQYKLLHADFELPTDDQDEVASHLSLTEYRKHGNGWGPKKSWELVDHFILAMYSRYLVTLELKRNILERNYSYEYVMFVRPDMMFTEPINIDLFMHTLHSACSGRANKAYFRDSDGETKVVLSPNADKSAKTFGHRPNMHIPKVDDKWAMCKTDVCLEYGLGFQHLYRYSQTYPPQSESWKSYFITKLIKAKVVDVDLKYLIIRANGHAANWQWCKRMIAPKKLESLKACDLIKPQSQV